MRKIELPSGRESVTIFDTRIYIPSYRFNPTTFKWLLEQLGIHLQNQNEEKAFCVNKKPIRFYSRWKSTNIRAICVEYIDRLGEESEAILLEAKLCPQSILTIERIIDFSYPGCSHLKDDHVTKTAIPHWKFPEYIEKLFRDGFFNVSDLSDQDDSLLT